MVVLDVEFLAYDDQVFFFFVIIKQKKVDFASVPATLDVWRTQNGCGATATQQGNISDATCTTWSSGCTNAPVSIDFFIDYD